MGRWGGCVAERTHLLGLLQCGLVRVRRRGEEMPALGHLRPFAAATIENEFCGVHPASIKPKPFLRWLDTAGAVGIPGRWVRLSGEKGGDYGTPEKSSTGIGPRTLSAAAAKDVAAFGQDEAPLPSKRAQALVAKNPILQHAKGCCKGPNRRQPRKSWSHHLDNNEKGFLAFLCTLMPVFKSRRAQGASGREGSGTSL